MLPSRASPRVAFACASAIAALVVACSTFSGTDDDASGDAGADGAATNDAAAIDDASTDGDGGGADAADKDAGPVNLLANGDFEKVDCAGWIVSNGVGTPSGVARSGAKSCMFCAASTGPYVAYASVVGPPDVGAQYAGSAWVHAAPDASSPSGITAEIAVRSASGDVQVGAPTIAPSPDDTWRRVTAIIDVTKDGGTSLRLELRATQTGMTCFLVDDAEIYRAK